MYNTCKKSTKNIYFGISDGIFFQWYLIFAISNLFVISDSKWNACFLLSNQFPEEKKQATTLIFLI